MIFDTETAILARLAAKLAPGSVLIGTFGVVDLTDDATSPVIGQLLLMRIGSSGDDRGNTARITLDYAFSVFCDIHRSTDPQKAAAAQMLVDAGNALAGWQSAPGKISQIVDGQDTGFDGRVLRLSLGFTIPAYFVGS